MDLFGDLPEPGSGEQPGSMYVRVEAEPCKGHSDSGDRQTQHTLCSTANSHTTVKTTTTVNNITSNTKELRKREGSPVQQNCVKKKKTAKYTLKAYLSERQGEREDMQDAYLVLEDFASMVTDLDPSIYRLAVFGVFDGHGGSAASRFASQNLHKNLQDTFKGDVAQVEKEIKKMFQDAFRKTDEDFLKEAAKYKPVWKDGSTAILVLVINDTAYIANVGDSQAVLCRYKDENQGCVPVPLNVPHNPTMYEERMRIQKAGGYVKEGRVMGVLEVSRSIGDGQYKKHGVTCVPDVKRCQLTDRDRFIIIACDGLWKCFNPAEGINFINNTLKDKSLSATETKTEEDVRYDTATARLANEAVLRLSADNVTVVVLAISKY